MRGTYDHYTNDREGVYDPVLIKEFVNIIKYWEKKRNALPHEMLPYFAAFQTEWIFQAKNFGDLKDVVDVNVNETQRMNGNTQMDLTRSQAREAMYELRRQIDAESEASIGDDGFDANLPKIQQPQDNCVLTIGYASTKSKTTRRIPIN